MTAQTPPNLPLPYNAPVRVLVHTVTGLVPKDLAWTDNVWDDKNTSMVNRISRYHWSGAYWLLKARRIRYYVYGCDYAYDDRRCYFLVDQGFTSNDEKVPILCWAWTGQDFKYTPSFLQRKKVQDTLKWYPFTRRHVYVRRNVRRKELSIRHQVLDGLRKEKKIAEDKLLFMLEHPDDIEWLADNIRSDFWPRFLARVKRVPKEKREATVSWKIKKRASSRSRRGN